MEKIKTIIIGLGDVGLDYDYNLSKNYVLTHSKAINKNDNFKILCGIDKDKKQILKFSSKYKSPSFNSLSRFYQLNKNKTVDLVVISVPENYHLITIKEVFQYYKPRVILCEKPMGTNIANAKSIVNLCNKNQTKLFVNYTRNVDQNFNYLIRFCRQNMEGFVRYRKPFLKNASHFLALFRAVFGKISTIKKNKFSDYEVSFRHVKLFFKSEKKKNMQNTYKIENDDYKIKLKNNFFLISNKKNKKINVKKGLDKKNNEKVILNIENYFKKKAHNLVEANIALELWSTMKKIK